MPTEAQFRAWLAEIDALGAGHPAWTAFRAWALSERRLYDASRRLWRTQSPTIDVAALEDAARLGQV
jgi:hypothetical protein